tara:strand:- start:9 stop:176 length:168 start_codon:yes stop_codon:yes gene_type:complete
MEEKKVKKTMAKKVVHKKKPENADLKDLQNIVINMHRKVDKLDYDLKRVLQRMGL